MERFQAGSEHREERENTKAWKEPSAQRFLEASVEQKVPFVLLKYVEVLDFCMMFQVAWTAWRLISSYVPRKQVFWIYNKNITSPVYGINISI